jgi:glycosyltransferase involved in cell wall biosynthesis
MMPPVADRPSMPLPTVQAPPRAARVRSLCVEGWRGINHSIALVNQHQLLEILRQPGWRVKHRDAPFFMPHWQRGGALDAGFSAEEQAAIDAIAAPEAGERFDACLRIGSPIRAPLPAEAQQTLTFMVTEFGLGARSLEPAGTPPKAWTDGDNAIVTPSRWSAARLADHGFDAARIHVVPHGYKTDVFTPMAPEQRRSARQAVQVQDHETLFCNVGVATWNKGVDVLLRAFACLRERGLPVRLFLKDHKALYGMGVETQIQQLSRQVPALARESVLQGISVLSGNLDQRQLRQLFAMSDAYVSPYRAEGFNLPVLEAMGCATPVIVTAGGATDDFVDARLSHRIASRPGTAADAPQPVEGRFCVPELDDLIEAMARVALGIKQTDAHSREQARLELAQRHAWGTVTHQLLELLNA